RLRSDPTVAFEHFKPSPAGILQSPIDELARSHGKARMLCAHSRGEPADHVVIGSRLAGWLDQFWPELNVLVTSTLVDVVMLEKSRGWQHHVGHARGFREELLVHAYEQIVARETPVDRLLVRGDANGIGVLNEDGGNGRPTLECVGIAAQHSAHTRLIEHSYGGVAHIETLDHRLVPVIDGAVVVKGTPAFQEPRPGHRGDATCRMHVRRPVARA